MRLLNEAAGTTQLFAAKKVRLVEAFLWKMSGTKSDALKCVAQVAVQNWMMRGDDVFRSLF